MSSSRVTLWKDKMNLFWQYLRLSQWPQLRSVCRGEPAKEMRSRRRRRQECQHITMKINVLLEYNLRRRIGAPDQKAPERSLCCLSTMMANVVVPPSLRPQLQSPWMHLHSPKLYLCVWLLCWSRISHLAVSMGGWLAGSLGGWLCSGCIEARYLSN